MELAELSKQETRIAERIARGLSEKEIANELFISPATVHNHSYNIRKKWKARSAVDVAVKYILSLENPKQFLTMTIFLSIQFFAMAAIPDMDLRKPVRSSTRTVKTSRKIEA